ncbi:hypothetical protein [uncultured Fluviicola sp.]|jgi:hypothetical protein|uniref:hypothetical protein n=1 Tax=uncultured Fluviicola sp. TaxID=463303 RepID=UPI0025E903FF|nr:hypothetical protein [uncultured Fluviicola sp.]
MNRLVILIVVLGSLVSCRSTKDLPAEQPKSGTQNETVKPNGNGSYNETYYLGEVQLLDCGPVVQVSAGEKKTVFSPVNLDQKFRIDKLRLKLKFKVLDEKATTCSEFLAIEIEEAFAVR